MTGLFNRHVISSYLYQYNIFNLFVLFVEKEEIRATLNTERGKMTRITDSRSRITREDHRVETQIRTDTAVKTAKS